MNCYFVRVSAVILDALSSRLTLRRYILFRFRSRVEITENSSRKNVGLYGEIKFYLGYDAAGEWHLSLHSSAHDCGDDFVRKKLDGYATGKHFSIRVRVFNFGSALITENRLPFYLM